MCDGPEVSECSASGWETRSGWLQGKALGQDWRRSLGGPGGSVESQPGLGGTFVSGQGWEKLLRRGWTWGSSP